jgi:hypothetical protein
MVARISASNCMTKTSPAPFSPAWKPRLLAALDDADRRARAVAGSLTVAQLNWRADPASWSIGQCLDHLRVANEVYVLAMEPALAGSPSGPVDEITPGWFGRYFIRTVIEPSAKSIKGKAPAKIVPATTVDATVLDRFLASNDVARRCIETAAPYDVNRVRFPNPFVALIRFTVGTGLEILTRHENRHLLQAERVRANPAFPG